MSGGRSRLEVRGLSHAYGDRRVLAGVDLEVAPGEMVGLLGPNGSGKSTVLSALQGLLRPDAGEVLLDGATVAPGSPALRAALGVVFQQPAVDRALTARENLGLTLGMFGLSGTALRERVGALLTWAGLDERADEPMKQFSGGMIRRIDLARAVAGTPRVLLMDEPSTGLDESSFRRVWALVDDLRRTHGTAVLVATHRPEEAERCDRLVVLHEGSVVTTASPAALVDALDADVVLVQTPPEARARAVEVLTAQLGVAPVETDEGLSIPCARGPEMVVEVVEALGRDQLTAVALRRPSLADAFMALSGSSLSAAPVVEPGARRRTRRGRAA